MPQRLVEDIKSEIVRLEEAVEALQRAAKASVEDAEEFSRITQEMRASHARIDELYRQLREAADGEAGQNGRE